MLLPLQLLNLLESDAAVAAVTGTASSGLTEAQIVAGGETIIITLTNDTFVAFDDTIRQAIIDGLDSAQSETLGWNAEVRDKEVVGAVVRTSDTVVTITLTAAAAYDVTADETITVTVPATAVSGGSAITASPTLDVTADAAVGGRRKKKRRYLVEIDNQYFEVSSIAEAQALLAQVREMAEEAAEEVVTTPVAPKPPRVKILTGAGTPTTSQTLQREVKRTQKVVSRAYARAAELVRQRQAIDYEIAELLQRKLRHEDEEDAILALLLT